MSVEVVVLASGGLDSSVLLARTVRERGAAAVHAFSVSYGSRHERREREALDRVAGQLGVEITECAVEASGWLGCSALVNREGSLPDGSNGDDADEAAVVVPVRNLWLAALGAAYAEGVGAALLLIGCNAGDAAVFPDCRRATVEAMDTAVQNATQGRVRLEAPLLSLSKREIAAAGRELGLDLELTWSCYAGLEVPCGMCLACRGRAAALEPDHALQR